MIETLLKAGEFLSPRERRLWLLLIPLAVLAAMLESAAAIAVLWDAEGTRLHREDQHGEARPIKYGTSSVDAPGAAPALRPAPRG